MKRIQVGEGKESKWGGKGEREGERENKNEKKTQRRIRKKNYEESQ